MRQGKTGKLLSARAALWTIVATAAFVTGCGGGGGAVIPDFEFVSINGVNGVRDNRTGVVWSRSLTRPDSLKVPNARFPTAGELLSLADGTSPADLQQYFGFAIGATPGRFRAAEPNYVWAGSVWTVDMAGVDIAGTRVRGALSADPNPYSEWFVLSPGTPTVGVTTYSRVGGVGLVTGSIVAGSRELTWRLCAEGSGWSRQSQMCIGNPRLYTAAEAEAAVAAANAARAEGYADWRLPTKAELQSLLELNAFLQPTIKSAFRVAYDQATPWATPFWTATPSATGFRWVVHFNDGAVSYTADPATDAQHVLLVR